MWGGGSQGRDAGFEYRQGHGLEDTKGRYMGMGYRQGRDLGLKDKKRKIYGDGRQASEGCVLVDIKGIQLQGSEFEVN